MAARLLSITIGLFLAAERTTSSMSQHGTILPVRMHHLNAGLPLGCNFPLTYPPPRSRQSLSWLLRRAVTRTWLCDSGVVAGDRTGDCPGLTLPHAPTRRSCPCHKAAPLPLNQHICSRMQACTALTCPPSLVLWYSTATTGGTTAHTLDRSLWLLISAPRQPPVL